MRSAVYVCARLLFCMRVCVLIVRLRLCVSMCLCVLSVRLSLYVQCALVCVCVWCVSMRACVRRVPIFGVCSVCAYVFGVHL